MGRSRVSWAAAGVAVGAFAVLAAWIGAGVHDLGSLVWVHRAWPAMLVIDGLPLGLGAVGALAARLREAEGALGRVRDGLGPFGDGHLAAHLDDGALLVEADGRVVASNPAARALFGVDPTGGRIEALLPDLGDTSGPGGGARTGDRAAVRVTATLPDGASRPLRAVCAPMPGPRVLVLLREDPATEPSAGAPALAGFALGLSATLRGELGATGILATSAAVDEALRSSGLAGGRRRVDGAAGETDLRPVLARAVSAALPVARDGGATLAVGGGPFVAVADPTRVEWVLTALLCEACHRSDDGLVRLLLRPGGMRARSTELLLRSAVSGGIEPLVAFCARWLAEQDAGLSMLPTSRGNQLVLRLPGVGEVPRTTILKAPGPVAIVGQAPSERIRFTATPAAPWVSWPAPDLEAVLAEDPRAVVVDLGSGADDDPAASHLWSVFRGLLGQPVLAGRPILVALGAEGSSGATLPDGVAGVIESPLDPLALGAAVRGAERGMRRVSVVGPPGPADPLRDALAAAGYPVSRFWTAADAARDGAAARVVVGVADPGDDEETPRVLVGHTVPARAADVAVPALGRAETVVELVDGVLGVLEAE